jgi:hypothetical protein
MRIDRGPDIRTVDFSHVFSSEAARALGGGWDLLRTRRELEKDISLFPQLPPKGSGVRLDPSGFLPTH